MENPEEVLQALDEFQKMRPSEIPRELEEYLCWVAKTGDPVYQWSLVKPLFREKLTRVMTDFYESCPSLELAPCPNVEQFNYDIMKCALLELLDTFAHAPFTVQRICELLTAPRKEYNRVDKFMRAIEKNILVVSTREPGPAARRGENGDVMVNGSADDDALSSQSTHEVEMESWVKDCAAEPSVASTAGESGAAAPDSVIAGKTAKITSADDDPSPVSADKNELQTSRTDVTAVATVSDEIPIGPSIPSPVVAPATKISDGDVENSPENSVESVTSSNDVPDAAMNEDTSSQPSLESETDDGETGASRKLQTTFQPKDFVKDVESPKFQEDESKDAEKPSKIESETVVPDVQVAVPSPTEDCGDKSTTEMKPAFECQETVLPTVETVMEKRSRSESEDNDLDTGESLDDDAEIVSPLKKPCSALSEPAERSEDPSAFPGSSVASKTNEETSKMDDNTIEPSTDSSCTDRLSDEKNCDVVTEDDVSKNEAARCTDDSPPETDRTTENPENSRPIIEEPACEDICEDDTSEKGQKHSTEQPESSVTIVEAMDDDTRPNKSIIPDPIPIVEEPKEPETALRNSESTTVITEMPDDTKSSVENIVEAAESNVVAEATIVEESMASSMDDAATIVDRTDQEDITEPEEKIEAAESMEVDGDEAMTVFPQDEPMEEEPGDSMKS